MKIQPSFSTPEGPLQASTDCFRAIRKQEGTAVVLCDKIIAFVRHLEFARETIVMQGS